VTTQEEEGAAYIKGKLIQEAQFIALSGDLRAGHDQIQRLREQWKQAGHAGRDSEGNDYESVLWRRFNSAWDDFYKRRSDVRDRAIAYRKNLVYEMGKLAGKPYDKSVGAESRALLDRWKQAEFIPKRDADQLWYEFDKYRQQIIEAGRRAREEYEQRKDERRQKQLDWLQGRRSSTESYLLDQESKLYGMRLDRQYSTFEPPSRNNRRYDEIMEKRRENERRYQEKVAKIQENIDRARSQIRDLDAQIRELG